MPPRQSSSTDPSGRGEQRPTLPPIRQIFGRELSKRLLCETYISQYVFETEELSRSVPPEQTRSPHMSRLSLADEDPRQLSRGASSPAPHGYAPGTPRSYPSYPDAQRSQQTGSQHPRTSSDPAGYPAYPQGMTPHPTTMQPYPAGYPTQPYGQIHPRAPIPTGSYPYAGAQHVQYPGLTAGSSRQQYPGGEAGFGDRSSTSRYECSYCGKGFTRPSSLRVRTPRAGHPVVCKRLTIFTLSFCMMTDTSQHAHRREA